MVASTDNNDRQARGFPLMTVCAGVYWASILLNSLAPSSKTDGLGLSFFLSYLALLSAMIAITCFSREFTRRSAQLVLVWVAVVGALVVLVASLPFITLPSSLETAVVIVSGVKDACFVMFWGLCFTTLDKSVAERTTIKALGIAFILYLALAIVLRGDSLTLCIANALIVVSLLPFLQGRFHVDPVRRPNGRPNKQLLVPFYATRAFLGACLGLSFCLGTAVETVADQRAVVLTVAAIAVVLASLWLMRRTDDVNLSFLRLAPLVACGATVCPFVSSGDFLAGVSGRASIVVWLCWIILHSVQVSAVKDSAGIDDALLSFSEKITYILFAVLTAFVLSLVPGFWQAIEDEPQAACTGLVIIMFLVIVVCSYQLDRVIDRKETTRILDNAHELAEQRREPIYEQLGESYGLTARERDVFRLLAKGYGRPAICEELCISDGTARTHVRHIYQKLDIHSHDELLALVEDAARKHITGQPAATEAKS